MRAQLTIVFLLIFCQCQHQENDTTGCEFQLNNVKYKTSARVDISEPTVQLHGATSDYGIQIWLSRKTNPAQNSGWDFFDAIKIFAEEAWYSKNGNSVIIKGKTWTFADSISNWDGTAKAYVQGTCNCDVDIQLK